MPSAKRVAWAQIRVGIVAVVAMVLLAVLVLLITGSRSIFSHQSTLYTYLRDSAALTTTADVRVNGILVGKVSGVSLSGDPDPQKVVKVTMEVDDQYLASIPVDSEAKIANENALGNKFMNITKGKSAETVKAGATIKAQDTSGFDDVVASGYAVMTSAQGMLKRMDAIISVIESGQGSIGKAINDPKFYDNLVRVTDEAAKFTAALNSREGTLGKFLYEPTIHEDVHALLTKVNTIVDSLQQGQGTMGKLLKDPTMHDEMTKALTEMRTLLGDLNAGKGTAGKMLKDSALHDQLMATMGKVDGMLDKINSGQGTLGQLMVNPQMYESMTGMTQELQGLLKDFRSNPKKFLTIQLKLF